MQDAYEPGGGTVTLTTEAKLEGGSFTLTAGDRWGEDVYIGEVPGTGRDATIRRPLNRAAAQTFAYADGSILFILILHDRLTALEQQVGRIADALNLEDADDGL
jgi:hypothetical protein